MCFITLLVEQANGKNKNSPSFSGQRKPAASLNLFKQEYKFLSFLVGRQYDLVSFFFCRVCSPSPVLHAANFLHGVVQGHRQKGLTTQVSIRPLLCCSFRQHSVLDEQINTTPLLLSASFTLNYPFWSKAPKWQPTETSHICL